MNEQVFTLSTDGARLLPPAPARLEKDVQNLFEHNLRSLLNLHFLASEFSTPCQTMRMDTLCLDEHLCPVIVEYKRDSDSSVISQGLFYLNWLMNNKAVIQLLIQERLGEEIARQVDWSGARVVFIAGAYTRYDLEATEQLQSNIDMYTYSMFESGILLLKQVASKRRHDYRAHAKQKASKSKVTFEFACSHAPKVIQDRIRRFTHAITVLSDDLVISEREDSRIISAPSFSATDLARFYLTEHAYPKLRLELFASVEDFPFAVDLRTKKTRTGFEFPITDDEYFDFAVEAVRQVYVRCLNAW